MSNKSVGKIQCYCGKTNYLTVKDMDYDEYECDCGFVIDLPPLDELDDHNLEVAKARAELRYLGTVRIMAIQETGELICLKNGVDEKDRDFIDIILLGYKQRYPEWQIFTEREELHV